LKAVFDQCWLRCDAAPGRKAEEAELPMAARLTASDDHHDLTLRLLGLIYEATVDSRFWHAFVETLSAAFGDSPVSLWMELPGTRATPEHYTARLDPALQPVFDRLFSRGVPFGSKIEADAATRFTLLDGYITDDDLATSRLYREWMRPQGLAPERPMVHAFGTHSGKAVASVAIHRVDGSLPFAAEDFAFADRLVPHLNRAYRIRRHLRRFQQGREVFTEVLDRLPTGILVLDETGKAISCNRAADLALEAASQLHIKNGRLVAEDRLENEQLQQLIKNAIGPAVGIELDARNAMRITANPDGGQLPLLIGPLLRAPTDSTRSEASSVVFISALGRNRDSDVAIIRTLFGFTRAEAEDAHLLCEGLSVDEVAERRGVKPTTVRSQIKSAFSKTGAKRQSDLVRIVLGGIASLQR
jgi:DNA-binding CsgD family transcriptional regulator/PAS domain-containing protein